jgi:dihydrofolate reductase
LLQAGQLDELEIHLVPVLLGAGRRLFETRDSNHIEERKSCGSVKLTADLGC